MYVCMHGQSTLSMFDDIMHALHASNTSIYAFHFISEKLQLKIYICMHIISGHEMSDTDETYKLIIL